ncbi:ejaculatory bulb-specific protein 3-like [Periplaneta americana]|uniref:ejaculatory bulb-specific protein 3-like n=1 Tax=Periplaneta americana TaxID=6978 RepID=UPI0037E8A671
MKKQLVWLVVIAVACCTASDLNFETVSKDEQSLTSFIGCLLDNGPCSADEAEFRSRLPEVVASICSKCDDTQKQFFVKTSKLVRQKHPEDWDKLVNKYDPEKKYETKLLKVIDEA